MEKEIKQYLELQCQKDKALAVKYDSTKLKECVAYINTQAREYLSKESGYSVESGYVADEVVYKWARDFFLEGTKEVQTEKKPKPEKKPKEKEAQKGWCQSELF